MRWIRKFLLPFSGIYYLISTFRNVFFDIGWLPSEKFSVPVIVIGNLNVGGTGKTPMVEFLLMNFQANYRLAVLSRGYGRKSKGFFLAGDNSDARQLGDEPYQIYKKFSAVDVAVDVNRRKGIAKLLGHNPTLDCIILDDAFQHRYVKPEFTVLLTAYGDIFNDDFLLPAGNLRESGRGATRADVIVVTKCPVQLSETEKKSIERKVNPLPHQKLFFTAISYGSEVVNNHGRIPLKSLVNQKICLVTGIANPQPLVDFLKSQSIEFEHFKFSDHHDFTEAEINNINQKPFVLTTEKDFVRLGNNIRANCCYLPVEVVFLGEQAEFVEGIRKVLVS
ncbi:MAG: tetraacyldisaccharide 4'-kinase [Flavobacteriales bacterium CG_4_9_14_3_um_filter_40_17]|nr:MAG: tetraacyldisaccharide 4'-kinase [Flavobacteriales bacterium CG_4_9_14_3_um_filter_40_17]